MTFAAPIWLLGLLPWTAVTLYLLWGRRRRIDVPFLDLWPARDEGVRVRRRATPPTVALLLAMLAMLLAILAACRPMLRISTPVPISVIVDRGWSMSAGRKHDYREAMSALGSQPLNVWTVPSAANEPTGRVASQLTTDSSPEIFRPTALATRDALRAAVRARLSQDTGPVIVFSDQKNDIDDERIVQVVPPAASAHSQIILLSARESPVAQVMVRIRGNGKGELRVRSGEAVVEREIMLPDQAEHDMFVNLPKFGQTIKAELTIDGITSPGGVAWLVRESSWPRIESRIALPAAFQRMVEVYRRQRPAGDGSSRLIIVNSVNDLPGGEPGVVLPATESRSRADAGLLKVADHPIAKDINWANVKGPSVASSGAVGWMPVVSKDAEVWVAVRQQPTRAVWVGFDSSDWTRSSDFVVFWANVFNWAGAGGEQFASHGVGSLEGEWSPVELAPSAAPPEPLLWPGLYRRSDGVVRAVHPPNVKTSLDSSRPDWRERLAAAERATNGQHAAGPLVALMSLLCVGGSGILWKRKSG
jgi:hypothetical protein